MCFSTRGLESQSDLCCIGVCCKGITSGLFWYKITFRFWRVSTKPPLQSVYVVATAPLPQDQFSRQHLTKHHSASPRCNPWQCWALGCTAATEACSSCWGQCCMQMHWSTSLKNRTIVLLWCEYVKPYQRQKSRLCHSICHHYYSSLLRTKSNLPVHGNLLLGKEGEHSWLNKMNSSADATF